MMTVDDLSDDQLAVFEAMCDFPERARAEEGGLLTVGGFAGTGKTVLTGIFARQAQKAKLLVAYIAFTGRASSVLTRSLRNAGVNFTTKTRKDDEDDYLVTVAAGKYFDVSLVDRESGPAFVGTIHRLIYKPVINQQDELLGWSKREKLDRDYDLIVVDEASMVSDEMLTDLRVFGVPILAVGDHGQLPPVRATGALMQNPDLRLETIHRQAEGNPIIALSRHVREGGQLLGYRSTDERVAIRSRRDVQQVLKATADRPALSLGILCWTNRQRIQLNGIARQVRGYKGSPGLGEVLVCLRNSPPVYNGMRGLLSRDSFVAHQPWLLDVAIGFPEEEIDDHPRVLCAAQFNRDKGVFASIEELKERGIVVKMMRDAGDFFDFGYALTVHKSQGSQFEHAIVVMDMPESNPDFPRWAYTAITRAISRLTILR
jgi:exodeoxyribonuclease-5